MKIISKSFRLLVVFSFLLFMGFNSRGCSLLEVLFFTNCGPDPGASINAQGVGVNDKSILICDLGKIYISDNMCMSGFSLLTIENEPDLNAITFHFNSGIGNIIVGDNGTLIRLTPDFQLESLFNPAGNQNLNAIAHDGPLFQDSTVVAVGDMGTVILSIDEGLTWTQLNFPNTYDLVDCSLRSDGIYVTGSDYAFFKTTDKGNTWIPLGPSVDKISSGPNSYNKIYVYDENLWFVAGPHGLILKSVDGGATWGTRIAQGFSEVTDLYFISPDSGAAVGPGGVARFTTDGGDTWFADSSVTEALNGRDVKRIVPFGRLYGTIIGSQGLSTFIAPDSTYLDSIGVVTVVEEEEEIPEEFLLYQNYPNPFNPVTKINWQSPIDCKQSLKIYDTLGNLIIVLVDAYKSAGKYEVEWDARSLPSGVYYYKLTAGSFSETKKLVLMK